MLQEIWRETGQIPKALDSRPVLSERWAEPYKVWAELSGSRNYTAGGPAGIPFSEFFLWALAYGYTREEMTCMWEDMKCIDTTWLAETAKRAKDEMERKKSQPKQNSHTRSVTF